MKNYLLDTHTLLWFLGGDKKLSDSAKAVLSDTNNSATVSIASFWEIGIKMSIGKLELSATLEELVQATRQQSIEISPIRPEHIFKMMTLPLHHRDPFDRIIIAKTIVEKSILVSKDEIFRMYECELFW